ncbi:MAG: hypothetical protein WC023_11980 [Rhodocyclaceae bacterium]
MKPLFEDKTQQEMKWDHPFYVIFSALVLAFLCAGQAMCVIILSTWSYDLFGLFTLVLAFVGGCWMISQSYWITFSFPKRVHAIFRADDGQLIVARDYPCKPVTIPAGALIAYNLSWGNFRLDLVQRGNAPHGLNIWFEYQGRQFWISESSSNYREALYLLAEHATLQQDPRLRRWERYVFWYRWRGHFKQRPQLQSVIDEIHRILAREQLRSEPPPEAHAISPSELERVAVPDGSLDSARWNDVPQQPTPLLVAPPDEETREFGNVRMDLRNGQATLTIKGKAEN